MAKRSRSLTELVQGLKRVRNLEIFLSGPKAALARVTFKNGEPKIAVRWIDRGNRIAVVGEAAWVDRDRHADIVTTLERGVDQIVRQGHVVVAPDGTVLMVNVIERRTVEELVLATDVVVGVATDVARLVIDLLETPALRCDVRAGVDHFLRHIVGGNDVTLEEDIEDVEGVGVTVQ